MQSTQYQTIKNTVAKNVYGTLTKNKKKSFGNYHIFKNNQHFMRLMNNVLK